MMYDVDAHAYDEVRYEEHRARLADDDEASPRREAVVKVGAAPDAQPDGGVGSSLDPPSPAPPAEHDVNQLADELLGYVPESDTKSRDLIARRRDEDNVEFFLNQLERAKAAEAAWEKETVA